MTSLTYGELELLICLHFSMAATGIKKEGVSLWCGWRPFKWPGGALMWLRGTLRNPFRKTERVYKAYWM